MTVYLVWHRVHYDGDSLLGVYRNLDGAVEFAEGYVKSLNRGRKNAFTKHPDDYCWSYRDENIEIDEEEVK